MLRGLRRVLCYQVRGAGVPVDVCLRKPTFQVTEERPREDRIAWSPEQQNRNPTEVGQPAQHPIKCRSAGMSRREGDVGHEVPDRLATLGRDVRCAERGAYARRELMPAQPCGGADERPTPFLSGSGAAFPADHPGR